MSFLRRISNAASAFLPSAPSGSGSTPRHVPRRATETFAHPLDEDEDDISYKGSVASRPSRASWELSDAGSVRSGHSSGASSSRSDAEDSEDDSDSEDEGRARDRYDMMVRHLWHTAERSGWFRDAGFDGLVSLRCVTAPVLSEGCGSGR